MLQGTVRTDATILPGGSGWVSIPIAIPQGGVRVFAVADDNGAAGDEVRECNEDNNRSEVVSLRCLI